MWAAMCADIRQRNEGTRLQIVETWPRLTHLGENVICGSFSWYGVTSKTRWILAGKQVTIGNEVTTPSMLARSYLTLKYPRRVRCVTGQYHEIMKPRSHPLYAIPRSSNDAVYLDLKAAHWSIVRVLGWDVDYYPGVWLGQGESMEDWPYPDHKLARNCLVTAGLEATTKMYVYSTGKLIVRKRGHEKVNRGLWSAVQDILHSIAYEVIQAGAYYVHTDGYLCDFEDSYAVRKAVAAWGFELQEKYRGPAMVYGPGYYSIAHRTRPAPRFPMEEVRHVHNLSYREWLRSRVAKMSGWPL